MYTAYIVKEERRFKCDSFFRPDDRMQVRLSLCHLALLHAAFLLDQRRQQIGLADHHLQKPKAPKGLINQK